MSSVSAREEFNQTASRQDPAVFDFEREVAQAWRDFPEAKGKILFFDASAGVKLVHPAEAVEKKEAECLIKSLDNVQSRVKRHASWHGRNSFCQPYADGSRFLFLYMEKHAHDVVDRAAPLAQETTFIFDHELAHAVVPDGLGAGLNRQECIGDAYAVIRHLQRYGADSPTIDAIVANRSFDMIFRKFGYGRDHFTSPVTEAILAQRYDIDWNSLTPAETAQKAREFVLENEMDAETLYALEKNFFKLHDKAKAIEEGKTAPIRALAKKVLATDSPDVFKYGAAALELTIGQQTAAGLLKGKYWDNVRRELAKKHKKFAPPRSRPVTSMRGPG